MLYDSLTKRVWAARDAEGVQPLFWGVTGEQRDGCGCGAWPAGEAMRIRPTRLCWLSLPATCCSAQELAPTPRCADCTLPAAAADDNRLVFGTHPDKLDGEADGWLVCWEFEWGMLAKSLLIHLIDDAALPCRPLSRGVG